MMFVIVMSKTDSQRQFETEKAAATTSRNYLRGLWIVRRRVKPLQDHFIQSNVASHCAACCCCDCSRIYGRLSLISSALWHLAQQLFYARINSRVPLEFSPRRVLVLIRLFCCYDMSAACWSLFISQTTAKSTSSQKHMIAIMLKMYRVCWCFVYDILYSLLC